MTTTIAAKRRRWWRTIGYEVSMLRGLRGLRDFTVCVSTLSSKDRTAWLLRNIITEGQVLHARNLCDFCTSTNSNDIRPRDFLDNYDTDLRYVKLKELMKRLDEQYGSSYREGDVRWAFNKMLAHPSKERNDKFDCTAFLDRVLPVLEEIIGEIETLQGYCFPELPETKTLDLPTWGHAGPGSYSRPPATMMMTSRDRVDVQTGTVYHRHPGGDV
jgi:hypothetical protein